MKQLYLECYSGISGDMTVAALLDLGADEEALRKVLSSLSVDGFEIKINRVKKAGIDACDFDVVLDKHHDNHDHDMEYLHGHDNHDPHHEHSLEQHQHDHEHSREHSHDHHHNHEHSHDHHHEHGHHHEHRGLQDVLDIIDGADMTPHAKELARKIFDVLANAEAKAHGVPLDQVHFHEVGAVDSIVDIISVAALVDQLKEKYGINEIVVPFLCEGHGTVRCQHGILPIPVPAVAAIMEQHHLPMQFTNVKGELVTPTGAAIVAALSSSKELPKQFNVEKIGLGAGKREYERPSLVRAMIIESQDDQQDLIYKLESNIDDSTGEALGYAMEQLLAAGARDVHYFPVFMKKNRPGYQLNVICDEAQIDTMEEIIFKETTTIGIRRVAMERSVLKRRLETRQTTYGTVQVKVVVAAGEVRVYPEYESIAKICREEKLSYQQVYQQVLCEITE